ncbi:hypothetical protein NC651_036182 [Populus alba x Populus x berolinensis]|nr:hypothetical protein NC651_036182 [Populus alba x Populus x berolinensis]
MISRYGIDRENHPSFDGAARRMAIGGVTKGRIYGAPGMPKSMVIMSASSQSYMMESTPPSSSIHALKEQIKKRNGHILSLQQGMTSIKTFLSNMGYQAWASNMDQGMSALMASSMPSHVAPQMTTPMYALSNPVHQPRPRPPYTDLTL